MITLESLILNAGDESDILVNVEINELWVEKMKINYESDSSKNMYQAGNVIRNSYEDLYLIK